MRTATVAAAILLALAAAPAAAETTNLRIYSILAEESDLTIDGGAPIHLGPSTISFRRLDPGAHSFRLTTASGASAALDVTLAEDQMSASRGRSWWCVVTGRTSDTNELKFMLDTPAQCQGMLDVAPADDVPDGE